MKKTAKAMLIVAAFMTIWKVSEAVVPPSTSLEAAPQPGADRHALARILEKLERHEEEEMNFLKSIRNEMRDLR